ncbi:hypothetical protein CLNEO_01920 [Anaerotignum neopropionicum]|uniref:Uncharacterized protein n=2 Tax=Anaerotignum neopropionicum TaxID=36847 RepID=A0A136WHQ3_9FIRM|nr:hypothetical protein CLNEO_01920 [Anaerotignum neopropionicum]
MGFAFSEDKRCNKRIIITLVFIATAWVALAGWVDGIHGAVNWIATLLVYGFIAVAVGGVIVPAEKERKKKIEEQWSDD